MAEYFSEPQKESLLQIINRTIKFNSPGYFPTLGNTEVEKHLVDKGEIHEAIKLLLTLNDKPKGHGQSFFRNIQCFMDDSNNLYYKYESEYFGDYCSEYKLGLMKIFKDGKVSVISDNLPKVKIESIIQGLKEVSFDLL